MIDPVQLTGIIEQIPEPGAKSFDGLATGEVAADGANYEEAHAALEAAVPGGYRLISIRRE